MGQLESRTLAENTRNAVKRGRSAEEIYLYVGLDCRTQFHQACVLDCRGEIVRECKIDHSGHAITDFLRGLNEMAGGKPDRIAVAIEVPRGSVVEALPRASEFRISEFALPGRTRDAGSRAGRKKRV
jgi:hypothetical protein